MFGGDYPCKYTLAEHGSCSVKGTLHQCHGGRTCLKDLWLTNGNYNIYIGQGNVVDRIEGGTSTAVSLPYQDNELHLLMNELGPYDLMARMLDCQMTVYFDGDKMAAIVADNSLKGDMSGRSNKLLFYSVLRPFQDYFSSYETGQSVGGRKRENPEKNHLGHPQAELGLSHMWPVRDSNSHRT